MKKIIGILICSAVFAMAYQYNHKPTDYINGKWYTCESVKVDTNGDTLYESSIYGDKTWYTYIKPHKISNVRHSYGTTCKISYSASGLAMGQSCSDGSWYKPTYDKNGKLIKLQGKYTTTTLYYDALENKIYEKVVYSEDPSWGTGTREIWYEYDGTTLLSKKISDRDEYKSTNETITYYPNGNKKYVNSFTSDYTSKHTSEFTSKYTGPEICNETEEWFDEHGYTTHYKSHTLYEVSPSSTYEEYYNNTYDEEGRIVYEGRGGLLHNGLSYQYFESDGIQYKCLVE